MQGAQPSQTAMQVAAARAAHRRYDPPPHILEDDRAEGLLGDAAVELIPRYSDENAPLVSLENRLFIPLRARYAEDRLAEAYRAGVRQLVVLGAGLDSYAFRKPAEQSALCVYEVDHPSTQGWKTDRIAALGWEIPEALHFVPCDFESTRVSEALQATSFDTSAPSVVTWMGVTYYLEPETAFRALVDLHEILAPQSEVVLDYQYPFEDLPPRYDGLREAMKTYLSDVGEPQMNRYRREALRKVILEAGYREALFPEAEDLYERYFAPLDTQITMSGRLALAVACR